MANIIVRQDFNWRDSGESASYVFGEDDCLKMDGSTARVRCSRHLSRPIWGPDGAVELTLMVVLGKSYHIKLFKNAFTPAAVDCRIDENGLLRFAR